MLVTNGSSCDLAGTSVVPVWYQGGIMFFAQASPKVGHSS